MKDTDKLGECYRGYGMKMKTPPSKSNNRYAVLRKTKAKKIVENVWNVYTANKTEFDFTPTLYYVADLNWRVSSLFT